MQRDEPRLPQAMRAPHQRLSRSTLGGLATRYEWPHWDFVARPMASTLCHAISPKPTYSLSVSGLAANGLRAEATTSVSETIAFAAQYLRRIPRWTKSIWRPRSKPPKPGQTILYNEAPPGTNGDDSTIYVVAVPAVPPYDLSSHISAAASGNKFCDLQCVLHGLTRRRRMPNAGFNDIWELVTAFPPGLAVASRPG